MLDEFKEEQIVNKVGGRFKLSALIQKRLVALNRGARPLVELPTKNQMEIVVAEIMQDKIYLDTSGNVAIASDESPDLGALATPVPASTTYESPPRARPRPRPRQLSLCSAGGPGGFAGRQRRDRRVQIGRPGQQA